VNIILKKSVKKLKETDGVASLFDGILVLVVTIMCLVLILSVGKVIYQSITLNSAAKEISQNIAAAGEYTLVETSAAKTYLSGCNMETASLSCDHSGTMQIGTSFTVKLSYKTSFGIGGVGIVNITLPAKYTATSGVFDKSQEE
jgi:hypothetical protein